MDPYSFIIDTASEHRLRVHIREVLLSYARTHLTLDHVAFTEKAVEELLLQVLEYVSMVDATSCPLPTEPLQVLMQSLGSLDLTPPEETWTISSDHARYLKTLFPRPPARRYLPTEKYWHEDDHYTKRSLERRPISPPVLSNRARRETPKLGSTNARASVPRTRSALTAFLDTKPVSIDVEDLPAPPVDKVLDLCLELDATTGTRIRSFFQTVLRPPTMKHPFEDTPSVLHFLHHDSPPRRPPSLDSPPLFPRVTRAQGRPIPGANKSDTNSHVTRISDLASILPVAPPGWLDDEDGDIHNHHMEVVSGHTALKFSSPPPPSPRSSDGSEIDKMWNISPPGTPATSLMTGKMDEIEIPRVRKFGHKNILINETTNDRGLADLLTVTKSPGFFITSFISAPIPMTQAPKPITAQLDGINSGMHAPRPFSPGQTTSHSQLVQPPSVLELGANEGGPATPVGTVDLEEPFDDIVADVYASTPQDPFFYIKEEKLDQMDIMLMDVPDLLPPTLHPRAPALYPKGLQSFLALKGELTPATVSRGSNGLESVPFLTPVQGVKHLALDLSWRPFNAEKNVPTDEDVADVTKPVQPGDEIRGYRDDKYENAVRALFDTGTVPVSAEDASPTLSPNAARGCEKFGMSPVTKRAEESGRVEYLLTRRERTRASGADVAREAEDDDDERCVAPDGRGDIPAEDDSSIGQRGPHGSQNPFYATGYGAPGRLEHRSCFDDSGVDIIDNHLGQFEFGEPLLFRQLEQDAVDTPEADKENIPPPRDVGDYQLTEDPEPPMGQYNWNDCFNFPDSEAQTFEPLSFASQSQLAGPLPDVTPPGDQNAHNVPPPSPSAQRVRLPDQDLTSACEREPTDSRASKRRRLDDLVPASSKDLFSVFIGLRNRAAIVERPESRDDVPTPHQTQEVDELPPRVAPDDVVDRHTVRLPECWIPAATRHRYLASMAFIQKHALVQELQGHDCRIGLVERYDLGGADIVLDPHYAVLFVSMLGLPAFLEATIERISRESWRYSNVLVVLEAFPSAHAMRADRARDTKRGPCAYTPPTCKAIKKLRRNLGIAEGCGTMNPHCTVTWAFANDVEEAAKFVRCFGEEACAISSERGHGMLWNEREWLEEEEREGESDLARVDGMNAFAAFVMLYDRSLEAILDVSPEVRLEEYGDLLGAERVTRLNDVIESRRQRAAASEVADE